MPGGGSSRAPWPNSQDTEVNGIPVSPSSGRATQYQSSGSNGPLCFQNRTSFSSGSPPQPKYHGFLGAEYLSVNHEIRADSLLMVSTCPHPSRQSPSSATPWSSSLDLSGPSSKSMRHGKVLRERPTRTWAEVDSGTRSPSCWPSSYVRFVKVAPCTQYGRV